MIINDRETEENLNIRIRYRDEELKTLTTYEYFGILRKKRWQGRYQNSQQNGKKYKIYYALNKIILEEKEIDKSGNLDKTENTETV